MPQKKPFVTLAQARAIAAEIPTPFHLYDEAGIRENARKVNAAFSWNKGFKEYFAVKATPEPPHPEKFCRRRGLRRRLLQLHRAADGRGLRLYRQRHHVFSNETPAQDMQSLRAGRLHQPGRFDPCGLPQRNGRYPQDRFHAATTGRGVFDLGNGIMDNPGDAKYGMSEDQMAELQPV